MLLALLMLMLPLSYGKINTVKMNQKMRCDILIVGGGLGGCAAALHAAKMGMKACLTEECSWIGGQITSQGVSALDEHEYIEQFGGTAAYYELRNGIRDYYRSSYRLTKEAANNVEFNPGNCWVSRLAFEPKAGLKVLYLMMQPYLDQQNLSIFTNTRVITAAVTEDSILSIAAINRVTHEKTIFEADFFIDATELGDLLPITGTEYVVGAESRDLTDEPHAHSGKGDPELVQSFTYTFAVEYCRGENHTIPKPNNYEINREHQPYSFSTEAKKVHYKMFEHAPGTPGSFWNYRRLIDSSQFDNRDFLHDIALINWHSNDFHGGNIIDVSSERRQQLLDQAKDLSLGFLYWLQTEAPRDDLGQGFHELKLRKDIMGTDDGLSQFPYMRESRRIKALKTIREQDISAEFQKNSRAAFMNDSVGIGKYWIDLHRCGNQETGLFLEAKPFQIPLGALIPIRTRNLIAGAKNIGTTHVTNGAYRLHPVEWAIGEAAAGLAVMAIKTKKSLHQIHENSELVRKLQWHLVQSGAPIFWFMDVPQQHAAFAAVQWLAGIDVIKPDAESLSFKPERMLSKKEAATWIENARSIFGNGFVLTQETVNGFIQKILRQGDIKFTRAQFVQELASALSNFKVE